MLLIDPATANPLELDQIQVAQPPSRGAPIPRRLPNGNVVLFFVVLNRGVVNSPTALPDGGTLPFK